MSEMLHINTAQAYRVRALGDLTLVLTWVGGERALVLMPARRKRAPWFVVCESAAWRYADDPRYLARQAAFAADFLELAGQAARIGYLIVDHLTDLRRMPPEPDGQKGGALGEARVLANGEVVAEHEVRADAPSGLTFG